jgi:hypothetical protein
MSKRTKELEAKLTAEQIVAAQLLAVNRFKKRPKEFEADGIDVDEAKEAGLCRLSIGDIAAKTSITERQLYNWRTDNSDFIDYVNALSTQAFASYLPEVFEKHLDMTLKGQGSMKGIELFYKFGGLLVDKSEVKTDDSGNDRASLEERLAKLRRRNPEDVTEESTEDSGE